MDPETQSLRGCGVKRTVEVRCYARHGVVCGADQVMATGMLEPGPGREACNIQQTGDGDERRYFLQTDSIFNESVPCAYIGTTQYSYYTAVTLSGFLGELFE